MRDFRSPLRFEPTVNGQRLALPRRGAGKGSIFTLLFGLAFGGLPGYFLGYQTWRDAQNTESFDWFALLPMLFCLPFVLIGGSLALSVLTLWFTRTTVRIEGDELVVKDGIGPLGLTRRRHADALAGFEISVGTSRTNGGPVKPMNRFATLTAPAAESPYEPAGKKRMPFVIAVGYPRDDMNDLAHQLADAFKTSGRLGPERILPVTESIKHVDDDDDEFARDNVPDQPETVPPQPDTSTITFDESATGTRYEVPALGLRKGTRGTMFFAVVWNVITFGVLAGFLFGDPETDSGDPAPWYFLAPFFAAFIAVGAGFLYAALRMGTRRATLATQPNTHGTGLLIEESNIFGKKTYDLPPGTVAAVHVGPSGYESNDVPIYHLRIHLTPDATQPDKIRSKPLGFFAERDDEELRWLASRLRKDLNVPRKPPIEKEASPAGKYD